jgi:hypothetical protein
MFIDDILQRLTFPKAFKVFYEALRGGYQEALHVIRGVGRKENIR